MQTNEVPAYVATPEGRKAALIEMIEASSVGRVTLVLAEIVREMEHRARTEGAGNKEAADMFADAASGLEVAARHC